MTDRLAYKPKEVAELLNCSRAKAYELIQEGELESFKVGKDTRVPATSLKAWMAKQLKAATSR